MKKEISIGLFAILGLVIIIWGYKYLLGQNLLKTSNNFTIIYKDVDGLEISSPVFFRGLQVGTVIGIAPGDNYENLKVNISISDDDFTPPSNTVAQLKGSVMGGKTIELTCNGPCSETFLEKNSEIPGVSLGLIGSMVDDDELQNLILNLQSGVGGIVDSLNSKIFNEGDSSALNQTIQDIQYTVRNLKSSTYYLNTMLASSAQQISGTFTNLEAITKNLSDNNEKIALIMENFAGFSSKLNSIPVENTFKNVDQTIGSFSKTIENLDDTFVKINALIAKINSSQGSLGALVNDKELYENLTGASKQLELLLQDVRLHPKRYVNVSVFGKKEKPYEVPDIDPAMNIDSSRSQ